MKGVLGISYWTISVVTLVYAYNELFKNYMTPFLNIVLFRYPGLCQARGKDTKQDCVSGVQPRIYAAYWHKSWTHQVIAVQGWYSYNRSTFATNRFIQGTDDTHRQVLKICLYFVGIDFCGRTQMNWRCRRMMVVDVCCCTVFLWQAWWVLQKMKLLSAM